MGTFCCLLFAYCCYAAGFYCIEDASTQWKPLEMGGVQYTRSHNDVEFMLSIGAHTKLRMSIPLAHDPIGPVQSLEETSRRK